MRLVFPLKPVQHEHITIQEGVRGRKAPGKLLRGSWAENPTHLRDGFCRVPGLHIACDSDKPHDPCLSALCKVEIKNERRDLPPKDSVTRQGWVHQIRIADQELEYRHQA